MYSNTVGNLKSPVDKGINPFRLQKKPQDYLLTSMKSNKCLTMSRHHVKNNILSLLLCFHSFTLRPSAPQLLGQEISQSRILCYKYQNINSTCMITGSIGYMPFYHKTNTCANPSVLDLVTQVGFLFSSIVKSKGAIVNCKVSGIILKAPSWQ